MKSHHNRCKQIESSTQLLSSNILCIPSIDLNCLALPKMMFISPNYLLRLEHIMEMNLTLWLFFSSVSLFHFSTPLFLCSTRLSLFRTYLLALFAFWNPPTHGTIIPVFVHEPVKKFHSVQREIAERKSKLRNEWRESLRIVKCTCWSFFS